ncbi:hypothetical protein [Agromyces sp. ZXT2-6]|uniref:hypothetical protein n=1 Tax=Agromyces sp. ZXT2-6 TaxID=3461153 RepID=UPI00405517EC
MPDSFFWFNLVAVGMYGVLIALAIALFLLVLAGIRALNAYTRATTLRTELALAEAGAIDPELEPLRG